METVLSIRIIKNGEILLAPFDRIETVALEPEVIPVPDAPEEILGVSWHENRLIPYACLRENDEQKKFRCGVLLRTDQGSLIGIMADSVGEILEMNQEEVKAQEDFMKILAGGS